MRVSLANKKILLFSPQFFGYGEAIASKLRTYGAEVDYFDERPGNDFWTKSMIRVHKSLAKRKTKKYYDTILSSLKHNAYDFVLFLNPEAISQEALMKLKESQSKATFIMYMWDSLKNKKHTASLVSYFDLRHTFDKNDSENTAYTNFNFRPLFFLDEYKNLAKKKTKEIDLLFVGTVHSDRYKLLLTIRDLCDSMGRKTDFFMFLQSKKLYYIQKGINSSFSKAKLAEFSFTSLTKNTLIDKIKKSKVVLDIQHPLQTGLTMRCIEMIGAQTKIITTNQHIKTYDFYNPNNILCVDRENIEIENEFFDTDYESLDDETYHKYSLEGWLEEVFSLSAS